MPDSELVYESAGIRPAQELVGRQAAEESLALLREALATSTALGFPLLQGRAEHSLRERAFDREANTSALHPVRPEIRVINGFEVRSHTGTSAAWTSRHEVSSVFCESALRLARLDLAAGDARSASDLCRQVVAIDPYSEPAGTVLIEALTAMEAHAEARTVRAEMKLRSGDLQRGMN